MSGHMDAVLYIHGKGGSAAEAAHYRSLFPKSEVMGLDYRANTPWEAGPEIRAAAENLLAAYNGITLVANSIGAYFSLHADLGKLIQKAYFISPVVDMEALIRGMMAAEHITETRLRAQGEIPASYGETLSWAYLCYVRTHPVVWNVPTQILYGRNDVLTSYAAMKAFARRHGAGLTVMETGGHWFHTDEQMRFLDAWIERMEKEWSI